MKTVIKLSVILVVFSSDLSPKYDSSVCDCLYTPLNEERIKDYDVIFSGSIISDTLIIHSSNQSLQRLYRFSVDTVFTENTEAKEYEINTGIGGGDCGFIFEKKRNYLVYALRMRNGKITTSICDPTKLLSQAKKDIKLLSHRKN